MKTKRSLLGAFFIPLLLIWNSSGVIAQSTGAWFTRKPLPTARQEIPHAVLNGKIYIPGGFASGGLATNIVEVFDPAANAWSTIAPLPIRMHHLAFAAANDRLYVLGGYTSNSFLATARVFEFDFTINNWTEKASMSGERGAAIAAEHDGKIYVIGGVNSSGAVVGTNQVYDPVANNWKDLVSMPTPREHLAAAVIDSLIYVIGGRNFSEAANYSRLEAYSPATNRWYTKEDMPTPRGGLAAAALRGKLYVFGGEIPGVFSQVEEYDPMKNSWQSMTSMPLPRHGIGAATVADTIFIIGGGPVQGFGVSNVNSGFTVSPATAVRDKSKAPRDFALYQNYPNPFNPSTAIRFVVPNTGPVTLKIFNALGNEMATLVNGKIEAGTHEIHWLADRVPAGIYFYRLQAQNQSLTRKLIIIK
ncbi:T9SS type A sorting domain-containing protein [candidate division KSB1 bacterium]|nr:T9SS type A sorting domain-containing protein [candidate division KSB1 bacterium]